VDERSGAGEEQRQRSGRAGRALTQRRRSVGKELLTYKHVLLKVKREKERRREESEVSTWAKTS